MLTASIVLYNTPRHQIERVFQSLLDGACVDILYIIDNSPNDRWRILEREYEGRMPVRYIHNENLGYGASHNLAMQEAIERGSTYHVVLNPDIRFGPEVLPSLVAFMDRRLDASYVLPKVVYPDGEVQHLCKLLPTPADLIFRRFPAKNLLDREAESPLYPPALRLRQGDESSLSQRMLHVPASFHHDGARHIF